MDIKMYSSRLSYAGMARLFAVVCAFAATVLLVVPFAPLVGGLDGEAWRYAMNVAAADHMVFGRDIIFTAGPLSTVYTHAYHPATDVFLIGGSLVLATALFSGFATITPYRRLQWLVLLPLLLSQTTFEGAMVLALPLLLLLNAEKFAQAGGRLRLASTFFLVVACALLPLVKGTMAIAVGACGALTFLALWRTSRSAALGLAALGLATLAGVWVLAGQPLDALPVFFSSQLPVISGYTVAMALPGPAWETIEFPVFALIVLWAMWRSPVKQGWRVIVAVALLLFISFKAGFVRHDSHATIAACALALAGLIAFLEKPNLTVRGTVGILAGFTGFALISMGYQTFDTKQMQDRLFAELTTSVSGMVSRITRPGDLSRRFAQEQARIRIEFPLPPFSGDADLYPENVAALLASGTRWNPRPTILSYTSYTPSLQRTDADHLKAHGAARIYFGISAIDLRYPAFQDALSWPTLLGTYAPTGFAGRYAILDRHRAYKGVTFGASKISVEKLGHTVQLPSGDSPLWAVIDVQPTLAGKLLSTLYKQPRLIMSVSYDDGSRENYTFVPGMASAGFLLSPTVSNSADFVALSSHKRIALTGGKRVATVTLAGESGTRWFWKRRFKLSLQEMNIPALTTTDALLFDEPSPVQPIVDVPEGGDCSLDLINEKPVNPAGAMVGEGLLRLSGWTMASALKGTVNDDVRVLLIGEKQVFVAPTHVLPRADVGAYFGHANVSDIGFKASIDTSGIHGTYRARLLQTAGGRQSLCPIATNVTFP